MAALQNLNLGRLENMNPVGFVFQPAQMNMNFQAPQIQIANVDGADAMDLEDDKVQVNMPVIEGPMFQVAEAMAVAVNNVNDNDPVDMED